jgi:hypothetical protein
MTMIKLPQLPDRTPTKLAVFVMPDLHHDLQAYAAAYAAAYGREVAVADLIPAILEAFLESDRGFRQRKKGD